MLEDEHAGSSVHGGAWITLVGRERGGCSVEIAAKKGSQQADRER
ncbi:unnamed protein product, partial [Heterotrigona itama]